MGKYYEKFYSSYFSHDGNLKSCIGSEKCAVTSLMPLKKYTNTPKDEVCSGCQFYDTNTEYIDIHLLEIIEKEEISSELTLNVFIYFANEGFYLSSLQNCGVTFSYPETLSTVHLLMLQLIKSAQDSSQQRFSK